MVQEFNEKKIRKELINLYKRFIKQPESENVRSDLIKFDRNFGGLIAYNDYLKSQPIPNYIQNALGGLTDLALYGQGFRNKKEYISFAKKTLKSLEKAEKTSK